jgi:tRNA U38,U39,U40 pseudouridine synthase TruA
METAAEAFVGTHDFTTFSHSHRGNVSRASKRAADKVTERGYGTTSYRLGTGAPSEAPLVPPPVESMTSDVGPIPQPVVVDGAAFDNVRTLFSVRIDVPEPGVIVIRIEGASFTHNMVRIIVGTLVEIGCGKRPADCIPGLLAGKDRSLAAPTAPSCGLCLEQVWYKPVDGLTREELSPVDQKSEE